MSTTYLPPGAPSARPQQFVAARTFIDGVWRSHERALQVACGSGSAPGPQRATRPDALRSSSMTSMVTCASLSEWHASISFITRLFFGTAAARRDAMVGAERATEIHAVAKKGRPRQRRSQGIIRESAASFRAGTCGLWKERRCGRDPRAWPNNSPPNSNIRAWIGRLF